LVRPKPPKRWAAWHPVAHMPRIAGAIPFNKMFF
jgi:hypothetical protein